MQGKIVSTGKVCSQLFGSRDMSSSGGGGEKKEYFLVQVRLE